MIDAKIPIPPPPVVRDRLARNIREGRLLRALLRLSVRAAEERISARDRDRRPALSGKEGGR